MGLPRLRAHVRFMPGALIGTGSTAPKSAVLTHRRPGGRYARRPQRTADARLPSAARLSQRPALLRLAKRRLGHLFPYIPGASPASTSACAPSPRSSWRRSRSLLDFHPPSAIACACSTRRQCRARPRARPLAARGSPGSPATATVARTIATSGASGFISCARGTGCRSDSSSLPPTPPSVWSRPSFSSARSSRDRPSSATRALPGGSLSSSWSR
jgi:hypothetical protein